MKKYMRKARKGDKPNSPLKAKRNLPFQGSKQVQTAQRWADPANNQLIEKMDVIRPASS
jgi:hypothetical protein